MSTVLHGYDIASHQNSLIRANEKWITDYPDFLIVKVTEGTNYVFGQAVDYLKRAKTAGTEIGMYHYARADKGNSATDEAKTFIEQVAPWSDAVYALDVEGGNLMLPNIDNWCRNWLDYVYKATGRRGLLYTSQSQVKKFPKVCAGNYGLWVAHYDVAKPASIAPWNFWAIWQYHVNKGQGIDEDIFNGDIRAWKKYAGRV